MLWKVYNKNEGLSDWNAAREKTVSLQQVTIQTQKSPYRSSILFLFLSKGFWMMEEGGDDARGDGKVS